VPTTHRRRTLEAIGPLERADAKEWPGRSQGMKAKSVVRFAFSLISVDMSA
jgi:hypothetical protein